MKIIAKNFSSPNHRITVEQNGIFLNAYYYKIEEDKINLDRFFFKTVRKPEQYKSKLKELLNKIEHYYGIELVQTDLKVEQWNN